MKRIYITLLLQQVFFFTAFSQNASDALRYSYLSPGGTARFVGAGGAFTALGADFSTLSQNPAGLAMFRSDEMIVTPGLRFARTESQLSGGTSWEDEKTNFHMGNFGLVFNTTPNDSKWSTFNVGIGFNQQRNFNQSIYYEGPARGSIMHGWFDEAGSVFGNNGNEDDLYPFGAQMAFNANAIYFQDNVLSYDFIGARNASVDRTQSVNTFGRMNELAFSFAGNYDERLMLGATIGVPFTNYRIEGAYTERDASGALAGAVPYFDQLEYTEFLRTNGVGVNFKLGAAYRLNKVFRVGGAFHTPTLLTLTDNYSNTFTYEYADNNGPASNSAESPEGTSNYRLRTPWRGSLGAAAIISKFGFLSADVEWVDYSKNHFNLTSDVPSSENEQYERALNNDISRDYKQVVNVRLGGELALDQFRLRAGYNLLGKPGADADGFNSAWTAGAGIRGKSIYFDMAYRRSSGTGSISPYDGAPVASIDSKNGDFLMTLGFKF